MTKRLYKWQLYLIAVLIALIFFILGAVLGTFLFMKNIDVKGIMKDHEYLKRQHETLKKKQTISDMLSDYVDEARAIENYNEDTVIVPEEEGK